MANLSTLVQTARELNLKDLEGYENMNGGAAIEILAREGFIKMTEVLFIQFIYLIRTINYYFNLNFFYKFYILNPR